MARPARLVPLLMLAVLPLAVSADVGTDWRTLTPAQREALAPLADVWVQLPADQRASLIRLSAGYPRLNQRQRRLFHERLPYWVVLTPEQRAVARQNYRRLSALPEQERARILQRWQGACEPKSSPNP
ncbi:MAG: DUF3106 domain-containing protein [Thiobacillaceae bacterium]